MKDDFESIRPFNEDEIPAATRRIADSDLIPAICSYLMPNASVEALRIRIKKTSTSYGFQRDVLVDVVEKLLKKTTDGFDRSGLENIQKGIPCLFVSNHRDIVLDAMLLQYVLCVGGYKTSYIAFGDNLMYDGLVTDFWKVNKMFQIHRGGTRMEFYNHLLLVSKYINYLIGEKKESVWISQRNGRTKDGVDFTDPAVLKMFGMSCEGDRRSQYAALNIVPVSVSYEWEPCDKMKALELYYTQRDGAYQKQPNEDLNSILTGITQPKGHVNFRLCPKINDHDLAELGQCKASDFFKQLALLIDNRIYSHYMLTPNNFIAHDLRDGTSAYSDRYTVEQKEAFVSYMSWIDDYVNLDRNELKSIFLGIYANPVDSYCKTK